MLSGIEKVMLSGVEASLNEYPSTTLRVTVVINLIL